jgi:hypothetical protein
VSRYFDNFRKEFAAKTARSGKRTKTEKLLVNLAESIGSTLWTLTAKADAAQKALMKSNVTSSPQFGGKKPGRKKVVGKSKKIGGSAGKKAGRPRGAMKRRGRRRTKATGAARAKK